MSEPRRPDPTLRFFGGALVAVGGLIFGLCGACTGAFLVGGLVSPGGSGLIGMALLIGVAPTVIGFILLRVGLRMYRQNKEPPAVHAGGEPRPPPSAPPPG